LFEYDAPSQDKSLGTVKVFAMAQPQQYKLPALLLCKNLTFGRQQQDAVQTYVKLHSVLRWN